MHVPDGFQARPPRDDEVAAVTSVVAASQLAANGEVDVSEADIVSDWSRPSFDLASDALVVVGAGDVFAYATQFGERASVDVAPHATGRGIGTALLEWTEATARRRGAASVGQTVSEHEGAARRLLAAHGYEVRWESWIFRMPLDDAASTASPPPGILVRPLRRPDDDRAVYEVVDTAFSEWPDREPPLPFDDWRAAHLDHGETDSGLVLLAEEGVDLVGAALCMQFGDEGLVDQLAVAGSHRGRGIGRSLLSAAFAEFHRRGLRTAALSTDSRTGARDLYEHVGMRLSRTYHRLSKPLAEGGG